MEPEAPWNMRLLMFFWVNQLILTGFKGGASYHAVNVFEIGINFAFLYELIVLLANGIVKGTVLCQMFTYATRSRTLKPGLYLRIEVSKTLWYLATLIIQVARYGTSLPVEVPLYTEILVNVIYFLPFCGAAYYGLSMSRQESGFIKLDD